MAAGVQPSASVNLTVAVCNATNTFTCCLTNMGTLHHVLLTASTSKAFGLPAEVALCSLGTLLLLPYADSIDR